MTFVDIFKWAVGKARPKIRPEPEQPVFPDRPGLFEDDIHRIAQETIERHGEREKAGPGPRVKQLFTNGPDGKLLKGDQRNQPTMTSSPGSAVAPGPASTKLPAVTIATPVPKHRRRDLRKKIKRLKRDIERLEVRKK